MAFAAPCRQTVQRWHFYGFNANFTTFYENKMAAKKFLTFYGFTVPGKHIFARSPWSEQHFSLTKTTAFCMYFSIISFKLPTLRKFWRGCCTLLASLPQGEGHSDWLRYGQVRLPTGGKGRKFESYSTKPTRDTRKWIC